MRPHPLTRACPAHPLDTCTTALPAHGALTRAWPAPRVPARARPRPSTRAKTADCTETLHTHDTPPRAPPPPHPRLARAPRAGEGAPPSPLAVVRCEALGCEAAGRLTSAESSVVCARGEKKGGKKAVKGTRALASRVRAVRAGHLPACPGPWPPARRPWTRGTWAPRRRVPCRGPCACTCTCGPPACVRVRPACVRPACAEPEQAGRGVAVWEAAGAAHASAHGRAAAWRTHARMQALTHSVTHTPHTRAPARTRARAAGPERLNR